MTVHSVSLKPHAKFSPLFNLPSTLPPCFLFTAPGYWLLQSVPREQGVIAPVGGRERDVIRCHLSVLQTPSADISPSREEGTGPVSARTWPTRPPVSSRMHWSQGDARGPQSQPQNARSKRGPARPRPPWREHQDRRPARRGQEPASPCISGMTVAAKLSGETLQHCARFVLQARRRA